MVGMYFFLVALCTFALAACGGSVGDEAFSQRVTKIDQLASSGSEAAAVKRLLPLGKKALSVSQRLGVYRRLMDLGHADAAEDCLLRGFKTHSDSPELRAVYALRLADTMRPIEALVSADYLRDTRFASILSEIRLSAAAGMGEAPETYLAAFDATGNHDFLQNAAVVYAFGGEYEKAAALSLQVRAAHRRLPGVDRFWAGVLLDAGDAEGARRFLETPVNESAPERLDRFLLLQDALNRLEDFETARLVRDQILDFYERTVVPPVIFYNRAVDAQLAGDTYTRGRMLEIAENEYPDYVPVLAALGQYALSKIPPRPDTTGLEGDVAAKGFASLGMEVQERILRVDAPGVLERMKESLGRHPDESDMMVEYFKLAKQVRRLSGQGEKKDGMLWTALERLSPARGECPPIFAHYAVTSLIADSSYRDARKIFAEYLRSRYDTEILDEKIFERRRGDFLPWEIEVGAYFAALDGDGKRALKLYEFLLAKGIENQAMQMDYILVLAGTGQYQKAVSRCRRFLDAQGDPLERSNMAFFLAELQIENHALSDAVQSLEYSLVLNPNHGKARLRLKNLRASKDLH